MFQTYYQIGSFFSLCIRRIILKQNCNPIGFSVNIMHNNKCIFNNSWNIDCNYDKLWRSYLQYLK